MRSPTPSSLSYFLALVAATFLIVPYSRAAEKPQSSKPATAHKVWTNEDLEELRPQGLITTFNAEPGSQTPSVTVALPSQASLAPAGETIRPRPARTQDPEWYSEQAAFLQLELTIYQDALRQQLTQIDSVRSMRDVEPGVAMDKRNIGVTPESGIDILQAHIRDVERQFDELSDLARVNGIPPGTLRV
jgi:hypothetical protein